MPLKDWTVLAYLVADHTSAARSGHSTIDEVAREEAANILKAADFSRMNVAVQVDFTDRPGVHRVIATDRDHKTWSTLPESDAARTSTIERFIDAVRHKAPARRYMLLLWGHGAGPVGFFSDGNSAPRRPQQADTLTLTELKQVLEYASGPRGFGQLLDLLVVKSCCVGSVEAVWEMRDAVSLLICSQAKVPVRAWDFDAILAALGAHDLRAVGRGVLSALATEFDEPSERNDRREVPYTLIAPAAVDYLLDPLMRLSQALAPERARAEDVRRAIESARGAEEADPAFIDVARLARELAVIPGLAEPAHALLAAMRRGASGPVIDHCPADSRFSGLSLFHFPPARLRSASFFADAVTTFDYDPLDACRRSGWHEVAFAEDPVLDARAGLPMWQGGASRLG